MFSFESFIDLPLIWGGLIALAVFLYVLLDGFDLGVGILFPFAPEDKCRDRMMNSIAPFWDGNETWLILGGGGLFAAFPLAYGVVMSGLYIPILLMLIALIFRGVAFEFRYKAGPKTRFIWDYAFHFGSLFAAFSQGVILGGIVQGIPVEGRSYAGNGFEWLTAFSMMTGLALVFGYALLGSTWLVMKTEDITQKWARKVALYAFFYMILFLGLVSLWVPFLNEHLYQRWFSMPNLAYLLPLPLLSVVIGFLLCQSLLRGDEYKPFIFTQVMFVLAYLGLVVGLFPYIVPYTISFRDAAASGASQSLLLVGALPILPVILFYTGYCYYVFRGKSSHVQTY